MTDIIMIITQGIPFRIIPRMQGRIPKISIILNEIKVLKVHKVTHLRVQRDLKVVHQKDLKAHKVHHLLERKVIRVLKVTEVVQVVSVILLRVE